MPEVMLRPDARVLARSLLATTEVVAASTLAHAAAAASSGDSGPSVSSVLVLALLTLPATARVLLHRATVRGALPILILAQLASHVVLTAMAPPTGSATALHATHGSSHLTWQMLVAHVVSAVVTAAVWRARRHLLDVAVTWPRACDVFVAAPRLRSQRREQVAALITWQSAHPVRGPPMGLAGT